ncbi:MAG TPA: hypothetical protein VMU40_09260 [Steroidobacteraceae bacterium]|nr:hypothetical protein [Steroidobacteraceae bacterium]
MAKLFSILVLSLGVAGVAQALTTLPPSVTPPTAHSAPEIDPSSALMGLTLLAGGLAVIRGRRSKR